MKSDEELRNGYKIEINKENRLVTVTFLKEESEEETSTRVTQLLLADIEKAGDSEPGVRFNLLTDLTPIPGANYASEEAKKLWGGTKIFDKFGRAAVVSKSLKIKVLVVTLSTFTGKFDNVKWFDEKEKALNWLNSSSP